MTALATSKNASPDFTGYWPQPVAAEAEWRGLYIPNDPRKPSKRQRWEVGPSAAITASEKR